MYFSFFFLRFLCSHNAYREIFRSVFLAPIEDRYTVECEQSKTTVLEYAVKVALLALLSAVIGVILYKIKGIDKILIIEGQK